MKVVINRCYGGFGVSPEAMKLLIERGAKGVEVYDPIEYYVGTHLKTTRPDWELTYQQELSTAKDLGDGYSVGKFDYPIFRDGKVYLFNDYETEYRSDPVLVGVVEELGSKANGRCAELKVVEIPDGVEFTIAEYDGMEHVAEAHRTWH